MATHGRGRISAVCTLVVLLSACSTSTRVMNAPAEPGGTLHGTEMLVGGPYQYGQHPAATGSVRVLQGTTLIALTSVKDGTFTMELSSGTYTVTDESWPGCNSVTITITPRHDATAQLTCDLP